MLTVISTDFGVGCSRQTNLTNPTCMSNHITRVKLKFNGSSFLVAYGTRIASSLHSRRHGRHPRKDATRMSRHSRVSGMSGDFPIQLATRLPETDWSAGGLLP